MKFLVAPPNNWFGVDFSQETRLHVDVVSRVMYHFVLNVFLCCVHVQWYPQKLKEQRKYLKEFWLKG